MLSFAKSNFNADNRIYLYYLIPLLSLVDLLRFLHAFIKIFCLNSYECIASATSSWHVIVLGHIFRKFYESQGYIFGIDNFTSKSMTDLQISTLHQYTLFFLPGTMSRTCILVVLATFVFVNRRSTRTFCIRPCA